VVSKAEYAQKKTTRRWSSKPVGDRLSAVGVLGMLRVVLGMAFGVVFGGMFMVLQCVEFMAMRHVCMMGLSVVVVILMGLVGFMMVMGRGFQVFRCLCVMVMLAHAMSPWIEGGWRNLFF
jgi:hypothetical protein